MQRRVRALCSPAVSASFVFAATVLLFAQSVLADDAPATKIIVEKEITYGKGGSQDLKLDMARPEHAEGLLPGIVFIHGGGWRFGNRNMYASEIQEAARRGYVAVTVSYRFTDPDASGKPKSPFPAQLEDVKCAVRWLRANADKYHVDPKRIGATGGSAGGHLSLMLGVTGATKQFDGTGGNPDVSTQVQAVVNYFGPTDLARMFGNDKRVDDLLRALCNGTPETQREEYRVASPVTYVTKDVCPILTLHGTVDHVVPVDQATEFDAAMKKAGATHEMVLYEGQGHGFQPPAAGKARDAMFKYFDTHLKQSK